jgi:phosphoribosyl 1,2-cyclic phosphodiesterase
VEANGKGILIDAGISYRRMSKELKCQGIDFCDIEAVLVTHEHTDHIRGLATLWKREGLPVYASPGTIRRMSHYVPEAEYRSIYQEMRIGEFNITAIPVSHDAEEPLGFAICDDFSRLMIATDLGCVNERILNEISQSQGVILESNHDVAMLLNGSYSEDLKRRILSQWGHLSNSQCSAALKEAVWKGLKMVVLAH